VALRGAAAACDQGLLDGISMRLNLGCGTRKIEGWVNSDKAPECNPDQVVDLEKLPWPWPDDSAEEVMLSHVLEHIGGTSDGYLGIIKELYRVCRDGATVHVVVPHPRHDHFLTDPTHVRPILPESFVMFSQATNRRWIAMKAANTPLAIYLGVDFEVKSVKPTVEEAWLKKLEKGEITAAELAHAARTYNNVIRQVHVVMQVIKPAGRTVSAGDDA
jgi:hypothetical protein